MQSHERTLTSGRVHDPGRGDGQMRAQFRVVVHLLVQAGGADLLIQRHGTGEADGLWAPPGGHLEPGEYPGSAALRECLEETGIAVPAARCRAVATLAYDAGNGRAGLNLLFAAELDHATPPTRPSAAWFESARRPQPSVPWLETAFERRAALATLADRAPWYDEPTGAPVPL